MGTHGHFEEHVSTWISSTFFSNNLLVAQDCTGLYGVTVTFLFWQLCAVAVQGFKIMRSWEGEELVNIRVFRYGTTITKKLNKTPSNLLCTQFDCSFVNVAPILIWYSVTECKWAFNISLYSGLFRNLLRLLRYQILFQSLLSTHS